MVDKNRIVKEYEELKKTEKENQIIVDLVDNNIRHWKGKIKGPVIINISKKHFTL